MIKAFKKEIKLRYFICIGSLAIILIAVSFINNNVDSYRIENIIKDDPRGVDISKTISKVINGTKTIELDNFEVGNSFIPVYFSVKNVSNVIVTPFVTINKKNWSSNQAIIKQVIGKNELLTDEEKAIKIMKFVSDNNYHYWPPYYDFSEMDDPVVMFNLFGYGFCSSFASSFVTLSTVAGLTSRIVRLDGHVVAEVFYSNKWHLFDADGGCIYRKNGGEIASLEEIFKDSSLLKPGKNKCEVGPFYTGKVDSYGEVIVDKSLNDSNQKPVIEYELMPNEEIRFYYNWNGDYFWSDFNEKPPIFTNGLLITKINPTLSHSIERTFTLPYPILDSYLYAKGLCEYSDRILFSTSPDGTWVNGRDYCQKDIIKFDNVFPKGPGAKITYNYAIRVEKNIWLASILVYTQFQVAPNSIPKLVDGKNTIQLVEDIGGPIEVSFGFE